MLSTGRIFLALCVSITLILSLIYHASVVKKPAVISYQHLTPADIKKAKDIIFHKVSVQTPDSEILQLTERDVNIAVNHLLNRHLESASNIVLNDGSLSVISSIDLSSLFSNRYINISFEVSKHKGLPVLSNLSIGKINISDHSANQFLNYLLRYTALNQYYQLAERHIEDIKIDQDAVLITYTPNQESIAQVRNLVAFPADNDTLLIYQQRLSEVIAQHDKAWLLSLADLLKPLFKLAYERSTLDNAIEENRHVIFIVSAYVNKHQWQQFLPESLPQEPPPAMHVYIYKRIDMAQHFIASAALSSLGSSYLANLMGIKKEIKDAKQGGSGFSFIDLAADRAGAYFGKMATSSPRNARKMQHLMSNIDSYTAFMPDVRDLPDQIHSHALLEQYQSVDSPAAQESLKYIDKRIKDSPIYKSF